MSESPSPNLPAGPNFTAYPPSSLGSLREGARSKNLKSARIALFVAFGVCLVQAMLEYATMDRQAEDLIRKEISSQGPGFVVDQEARQEMKDAIMRIGTIMCAGILGMALIFLVLAFLVYKFPLFCTVGGLILYLGYALTMAYLISADGEVSIFKALWAGILWKIIIIVGLVKGIQSAVAYQNEAPVPAS